VDCGLSGVYKEVEMFYCDDCADEKSYPISWFKSYGNCEMCGKTCKCNEVSSKDLPKSINAGGKHENR